MLKPYTCHKCKHEFDLIPDALKEAIATSGKILNLNTIENVKVKCSNCHEQYKINTKTKKEFKAKKDKIGKDK